MTFPGMRSNHQPPDPAALAVLAIAAILAAILLPLLTGCVTHSSTASVPAWTNAAPYEGARGPSW